jgi:hypothetical protein
MVAKSSGEQTMTLSATVWELFIHSGDPAADAVAAVLLERGTTRGDAYALVRELAEREGGIFAAFTSAIDIRPDWVDDERVRQGQCLFLRAAPLAMTAFVLGTLPLTYTPEGSAKVLSYTGRLDRDVRRRLYETAVMVREVLRPDAFAPNGPGRHAIARVRLLHAMVRQRVLRSGRWPTATLGMPINQLQLGQTAIGFSLGVIRGLEALGVRISATERDGYQHLWRYANLLQGVDPAMLPATLEEEQRLHDQFRTQLMEVGDEARALVASLHAALAGNPPFWLPLPALQALSRLLIADEDLCGQLHLPRRALWEAAFRAASGGVALAELRFVRDAWKQASARRGEQFFGRIVEQGLGEREAEFQYSQAS